MARNMPPSAAGKVCERQDCKQRRRKRRKVEGQYAGACARTQENHTRHSDGLEAAGIDVHSSLRWLGRADEAMRLGATDGTIWVKTVRFTALLKACYLDIIDCDRRQRRIASCEGYSVTVDGLELNQDLTSVLPFGRGKPQILRIILGTSVTPTHHCQSDSRQGGKGMLPLRFFQQSCRAVMQPREEKARGLTTADWVRMCRATSGRDFQPSQNEREGRSIKNFWRD
jgi:hypothetical protein